MYKEKLTICGAKVNNKLSSIKNTHPYYLGINLRTARQGIFPAAHVTDIDYLDFDPNAIKVKKERYILNYLGSIQTLYHKGNDVLTQAVKKISKDKEGYIMPDPHPCILEVSDQGIRMVDRRKPVVSNV